MKAKLNLDTQKIKDFFLAHTEKIVFGLFAFGCAWFVYGAVSQETYQRNGQPMTPALLDEMNRKAQSHLESQVPDVEDLGIDTDLPDPSIAAAEAEKPVKPNETFGVLNPGVWAQNAKRGEPEYLPLKDLRASAGYGAFQVAEKGVKGGKMAGFRWVVLTGLYQAAAQETRYTEKFRNSDGGQPSKDVPRLFFVPFRIERRDITNGTPEGDQGWSLLSVQNLLKMEQQWVNRNEKVVDEGFILEGLTRDLPSLLAGKWDDDQRVAHQPEIRLLSDLEEADENPEPEPTDAEPEVDENTDPFGVGDEAPEEDPKESETAEGKEESGPKLYRLFRFFDFSVKPGLRYEYRVRIAFANPNYGVKERFLAGSDLGKSRYRLSQWSESSGAISVPRDNDVVAGPVKAASGANEATVSVILNQWESETGLTALERFDKLMRGQLANYATEKVPVDDPTGKNGDLVDISFQTDTILLDLIGGGTMGSFRIEQPGEMLMMDADNRLVIRSELDDFVHFRKDNARLKELKGEEPPRGGRRSGRKEDREKEEPFRGAAKRSREKRSGSDALGGSSGGKKN